MKTSFTTSPEMITVIVAKLKENLNSNFTTDLNLRGVPDKDIDKLYALIKEGSKFLVAQKKRRHKAEW